MDVHFLPTSRASPAIYTGVVRELSLNRLVRDYRAQAKELERRLPAHVEGELLVKLKPDQDADRFLHSRTLKGLQGNERFEMPEQMRQNFGGELLLLKLPAGISTSQAMAALEHDPRLAFVAPNTKRFAASTTNEPNDPLRPELWGMDKIGMPEVWARQVGSQNGPIIAVLDTGCDTSHPDLRDNLWTNRREIPGNGIDDDGNGVVDDVHGYNACHQTGDPYDDDSHGTHCAGTIAAKGNNAEGVVGVNWDAQLMPVKMMVKGEGTVADTVRAVIYATKNGASITSNSYSGPYNQAEYEVFASSPLLHVCAAGNETKDNDVSQYYPNDKEGSYPASYELPNIVAVASSDTRDRMSNFSNYGATTVDLAAPGSKILSTMPGGGYDTKSGTSMATPHVAGVAGLIAGAHPEANPAFIKDRLLNNVDETAPFAGKVLTGGRLNAARATSESVTQPGPASDLQAKAEHNQLNLQWQCAAEQTGKQFSQWSWTDADGRSRSYRVAAQPGTMTAQLPIMPSGSAHQLQLELVQLDQWLSASPASQIKVAVPAAKIAPVEWVSDGKWGQVELPGRGKVWTDSPQGNYANRENSSLTSQPFRLEGQGSQLTFETRHRLEPMSDSVRLEIRELGQEKWSSLEDYTSYSNWKSQVVDLSAYDGKTVELRFHLTSDSVKTEEGIYLDRICVAGR